ncbi:MAG: hypothetical protein AAB434_12670 [Planctomycetota bacterium]
MRRASASKVLLVVLVVAAGAGAVVAYTEMNKIRGELSALQSKVAQLDRKGAEPTASAPAAVTPVVLPSSAPTAAEAGQEMALLHERLAALEARIGGEAGGGAQPAGGGSAVSAAGAEEAARIAASMSEDAKKAIAAVVKETLDARDKERTAGWASQGVDRMLSRLAEQLALSESQKALLKPVLDARAKKMAEMFTGGNFDRDTMRTQIDVLRKETDEDIKRHLTAEQAQKYDEVAAQSGGMGWFGGGRGDRGGNRGGDQGGGGR